METDPSDTSLPIFREDPFKIIGKGYDIGDSDIQFFGYFVAQL